MDMLLAAGIVKLTNQSCEVYYKVYAVSFVTVNAIFHNFSYNMDTKVEKWWGKCSCQRINTMTCQTLGILQKMP